MPYWLDWIKRDSRFPLPSQIKKALLSEANVKNALASGEDPIRVSIKKWNRIITIIELISSQPLPLSYLNDLAKYIGYRTCALCIDSINRYESVNGKMIYGSDKCKVCALAAIDQCTRKGSIYDQIEELMTEQTLDIYKDIEKARMDQIAALCKKMIDNLERLNKP